VVGITRQGGCADIANEKLAHESHSKDKKVQEMVMKRSVGIIKHVTS